MAGKRIDMIGLRFGRLVVVNEVAPHRYPQRPGYPIRRFRVRCDCGKRKIVRGYVLREGDTLSCGCLGRGPKDRHGQAATRSRQSTAEYRAWINIKTRCYNPKVVSYKNYGKRGIKVCARWRASFEAFFADMGPKPSPSHTIDRYPDNDGDYKPSNCRWATWSEQHRNKRRSIG